jgi:hypothetical protein
MIVDKGKSQLTPEDQEALRLGKLVMNEMGKAPVRSHKTTDLNGMSVAKPAMLG